MNLFFCVFVMTVACNREMQPFFKMAIRCGGEIFGFGSGSGSNLTVLLGRVGLGQTISGLYIYILVLGDMVIFYRPYRQPVRSPHDIIVRG